MKPFSLLANMFLKQAQGPMPPMDPAMMGGAMPPMDPAMMGGAMPPGAMPPGAMPPGAMPPGAMPPGAMPPPPPMDPLIEQILAIFEGAPPGMFSEMVQMPVEQLTELAQSGEVPPEAIHLVLFLRQDGLSRQFNENTTEAEKLSSVRSFASLIKHL